ncbi:glycosyltransferase family 2 protein [Cohnella caldifontis]|uniref:glycosyltransferase family 2 protein n=1 Tax=Cohnella caldifontis TaxID=3027471 RepID=UPI0023EB9376|nr:glycosyltransferase family 2 protein [Cohnella sp. YIM B05605]
MAEETERFPGDDSSSLYREGFEEGWLQGVQSGLQQFFERFEGTSIVIPTCNALQELQDCLDSIEQYTRLPHEVIVVDNASTDGTDAFLESLRGQVRYQVLTSNVGLAGAINRGLMMAKGRTLALLSPYTVVTENWLEPLMSCLEDPEAGMAGPVANDAGGEQGIPVPHRRPAQLQDFASWYNRRNPGLRRTAKRLRSFCLLFRRETFEDVGYWDEGLSPEDAETDFNLRVRMTGKRLMIAQGTFVQFSGSRCADGQAQISSTRNQNEFFKKWTQPDMWLNKVLSRIGHGVGDFAGVSLFPQRVMIRGLGETAYWVEGGMKHPVEGELSVPIVRVTQVELRRWPSGEPIAADVVEHRWRGLDDPSGWEAGIAVFPDGTLHHLEGNSYRPVMNRRALEGWQLHLKPIRLVAYEEMDGRWEGFPIIPLPEIRQHL